MTLGTALVDEVAVERCLEALRATPSGLLTDIDGTISPMARTPAEATVSADAKQAMTRLRDRLAVVGVVTGRSAQVGESLVGVPGLLYVGNHGMEWIEYEHLHHHPSVDAWQDQVRESLVEIAEIARRDGFEDGLLVEDKRFSGSIHYRLAPDPAATHRQLVAATTEVAGRRGLRVTHGRLVIEVRPPVQISKGTALKDVVQQRELKGIVFLGDDITDVDGFRAVKELRETAGVVGVSVGVVAPETPPELVEATDVTVAGVTACVGLLTELSNRLRSNVAESSARTHVNVRKTE